VSSVSNRAVRHARHALLHSLDTSNVSSRVVSRRDEPSGIWALIFISMLTRAVSVEHIVVYATSVTGLIVVRPIHPTVLSICIVRVEVNSNTSRVRDAGRLTIAHRVHAGHTGPVKSMQVRYHRPTVCKATCRWCMFI